MLDAGYDANENCRMIRNTGRRPVICTHKNHVVRGFCPRAEMLRWQEKNPEEFEKYKDFLAPLFSFMSPIVTNRYETGTGEKRSGSS